MVSGKSGKMDGKTQGVRRASGRVQIWSKSTDRPKTMQKMAFLRNFRVALGVDSRGREVTSWAQNLIQFRRRFPSLLVTSLPRETTPNATKISSKNEKTWFPVAGRLGGDLLEISMGRGHGPIRLRMPIPVWHVFFPTCDFSVTFPPRQPSGNPMISRKTHRWTH